MLGSLATVFLVAGCTDSAYDLSNIDTSSEIKVTNLAIPINMDAITLDQMIDVKEGESLQVVDGKYAVKVEGNFESDPVRVKEISIPAPEIEPTITPLNRKGTESSMKKLPTINFAVPEVTTSFSYSANDVDPSIVDLTDVKVSGLTLAIKLSLPTLTSLIDEVTIHQLTFEIPKGLHGTPSMGTYSPATGRLEIINEKTNPGELKISLPITEIELHKAGAKFNPTDHTFEFQGDIKIVEGEIGVDPEHFSNPSAIPTTADLRVDYNMSSLEVSEISGRLKYNVPEFIIPDVDLTNLPDFLRQEGTNLVLNNPQIYLAVKNPLYETHLTASTGLTLSAIRDGRPGNICSLPQPITIESNKGEGPYKYCLSPSEPTFIAGFEDAQYRDFPKLGNIVAGDGLPDAIHIVADDPTFPEQNVTDLKIGYSYGSIAGEYSFFAPLALDANSTITYSDSDTGWASEDLDDVTIDKLVIKANVTTDIDAKVIASGMPLDKQGHAMENVTVSDVTVEAKAQEQAIEIIAEGDITGIDGFLYKVTLMSAGPETLAPNQHIKLTNIRAYVTGKYVTKDN